MKLELRISHPELETIRAFVQSKQNTPLYVERLNNINSKERNTPNKDIIWKRMVECLLSTQQRSSPGDPIDKFSNTEPFPLNYKECLQADSIEQFVTDVLTKFGGIRRAKRISEAININLNYWEKESGWKNIFSAITELKNSITKEQERECVERFMGKDNGFHQFGPKQIRNFFQMLGLVKYEIPIDSRTIKWLNEKNFPVKLSGSALGDRYIYNFVLDIVQEICEKINIYPTLFDAAVFTNYDNTEAAD